VCVCVCAVHCI